MADSKLILEIGARLDATFSSAFSSAQAKINALGKELSELKYKQNLIKRFEIDTQNLETAKQRLEAARQKVDDLRKAAANDPTGSLNKQLAAAEREAEKLNTTLGKTEERLQRTKERMESAGLSAENTGQQLETLAKQAEKVEKAIASKGAAMERNNRLLGQFKLSVLDVADSYKTLAAGLLATKSAVAVLAAAVAGAVPVLGQMAATGGMIAATFMSTLHIAGVTKEMQGLADTTGMTTQSLRELQLLSGFEGVDRSIAEFGDATKSLEAINQRIMQIGWSGTKNDNFAAYLDEIGINVDELRGKKPDEVLLLIDDALKKTGATARETENFFEAIAGKGTAALIPLLQKQNAELALARQYISDVGAIQSESEIAAMTQTNKELSLFKIGLEGVATRLSVVGSNVVNTLGPNIRQLFIDAKKPIAEWGEAVDKTLKKFKADLDSGGWGMAFSNMFKAAYPTLHQFVSSAAAFGRGYGQTFIGPMLEELKKGYAGISNALAGAGGAEALGRGMGEAMQPVISIVHNVVGAVKLLIANWDTLKTVASFTPVGFVVSHWDAVVSVFSAVGNGIRRVGEALGLLNPATTASASGVQIFLAALGGLLAASASTKLALGLVGAAVSTFAFALGPLASALGIAATAFKTLALAAIANPIGAAIAVIAAGAVLIYANWDKISGWWSGLWSGIKSAASNFASWWSSWTLKEIAADVTFDTLVWAYEKGQAFSAWWNSWELPMRNADVEYGMMEYAYDLGKRFANWWNSLTLKSIIADIKMPELPSVFEWGKSIGKDLADGAAEGLNRATSHITAAEKTANKIPLVMRAALDTHSPSKITEAIGADTAAGLGLGIEKEEKKVKSAAEKTAQAAADGFKSVMEGITKQTLQLTAGDEAARRYELSLQGIEGANQNAVIAAEAHIKALEAQKKKTDDAKAATEATAKTYKDAMDRLQGQTLALTQGEEAGRRWELTLQGIVGSNQNAVIAAQNHIKALEEQKKKTGESKTAFEDAQKAVKESSHDLDIATKGLGLNDEQLQALTLSYKQGYTPEMARAQAASEAKTKTLVELRAAQIRVRESLDASEKTLKIAKQSIGSTDEQLHALTLSYEKGYTPALAKAVAATEAKTKVLQSFRTDLKSLNDEQAILQARLKGGEIAARAAELGLKGYNTEQIAGIQGAEAFNKKLSETIKLATGIGDAITEGLFSGNWKSAGQSILGELKTTFVDPLKQSLSDAISQGLANGPNGGIYGSIAKLLNFDGIKGALGGVGNSIGGLFSGIAASAANGFTGIGTAISGGLSGIMGSFGTLVSAIPGWGWALAGVAGLAKLFGGPSDPKLRFTQGAIDNQAMLEQGGHGGHAHNYKTAFGTIGATAASDKIGREKDFVPKFHAMMQQMQGLDQMIADTMPHHVAKFTAALKGLETSGFSIGDMLKQRYQTVFSTLPEELQKAMANGRDMTKLTAEEIIAEFGKLSEVAKSGLATSLQSLGLNLGKTQDSALAAAVGLTNLMGGIDKVKAANDFFYAEFFSDEERKQATLKQASSAVRDFNKELGLSGKAAIDSHAEFKKYVLGLDLTTEAGRKAYAQAMAVAGSLDAVADAAKAAAAQHAEVMDMTRKLGIDFGGMGPKAQAASSALVQLMGGMDKLTQATNFYYDQFYSDKEKEQLTLAQAAVDVRNFNKGLGLSGDAAIDTAAEFRKYVGGLNLQTEEGRKAYAQAMNIARSMDTVADSGKSVNKLMAELPRDMIKMFQGVKKPLDDAGTAVDKNAKLAAESMQTLSNKSKLVSDNATTASTNLQTMRTAVVALADVLVKKAGEISAAAATTTTTTTTSTSDGSHALGLRTVPFDGYRAILHKNEAVIPARDAAILRLGLPVQMDAQTNILALDAANDSQSTQLPVGVTPLPQRVTQALQRVSHTTQATASASTAPITITINAAPGQDAAQIAAEVERALKRHQAQQARLLRAQHRDMG